MLFLKILKYSRITVDYQPKGFSYSIVPKIYKKKTLGADAYVLLEFKVIK